MSILYRVKRDYAEKWSRPLRLEGVMERASRELVSSGSKRFRMKRRGGTWGRWRDRQGMLEALKRRLGRAEVGELYIVEPEGVLWELRLRVVEPSPRIPDSPGTRPIDIVRFYTYSTFKHLESWGICSCRRIANSTTWSQHAYCNAEDFHAEWRYMADVCEWLVEAQRGRVKGVPRLPISQIIFSRRIFTPQRGWAPYSGMDPHTDHIHVSGSPLMSGTPGCA